MMRLMLGLALVALAGGCDEKKDAPATATAVAPATPSGAAVAPSGAAVAPSGAAVAPSGAPVAPSGAAVAPSGAAVTPSGAATKTSAKAGKLPAPSAPPAGMMPHGSAEEGTLKYNPPAAQNPSGTSTKK